MSAILDTLTDPSGLYALTAQGQLGVYNEDREFSLDTELSAKFSTLASALLRSYNARTDGTRIRVGFIFRSSVAKPWGETTFFFDEDVVREIYPVTGPLSKELTAFQKRNREKSIYRAMEALLTYKANENLAFYCPVLYDRGSTLDHYLLDLGRAEQPEDKQTAVLEVLNLAADMPVLSRNTPEILALHERLYSGLIKSERRRGSGLTLVDDHTSWKAARSTQTAEKPMPSGQTVAAKISPGQARSPGVPVKDFSGLHASESLSEIERWRLRPPRTVEPASLARFTFFEPLNDTLLAAVAKQCWLYQCPAGTPLLERGMTDKWNLFLIDGSLQLEAQDGARLLIEGGSSKAAKPISSLKPRMYRVIAATPASFLWVHDALLSALTPS